LRLTLEALHAHSILRESFGQSLDRHITIQLRVGGAVDSADAASPSITG
jgi:hypothetical protein